MSPTQGIIGIEGINENGCLSFFGPTLEIPLDQMTTGAIFSL